MRPCKAADERDVVLGELMELALYALEAVAPLQRLADKRNVNLSEVVTKAIEFLERAGDVR